MAEFQLEEASQAQSVRLDVHLHDLLITTC